MKQHSSNLFFETLATTLRVNILDALKSEQKTVNELCQLLNEDQSKVSHNLKRLKDCHFIQVKKKGKHRIYSLNQDTIVPLLNLVERHVKKYCCAFCGKDNCKRK